MMHVSIVVVHINVVTTRWAPFCWCIGIRHRLRIADMNAEPQYGTVIDNRKDTYNGKCLLV